MMFEIGDIVEIVLPYERGRHTVHVGEIGTVDRVEDQRDHNRRFLTVKWNNGVPDSGWWLQEGEIYKYPGAPTTECLKKIGGACTVDDTRNYLAAITGEKNGTETEENLQS